MKRNEIIGRTEEMHTLSYRYGTNQAELVVVYGRRRVGKTFLIRSYFNNQFDFCFVGAHDAPTRVQLKNFTETLRDYGLAVDQEPKNWWDAFNLLYDYLKSLPKDRRLVVFFDEMPWMDNGRNQFASAFEYFWNAHGSCLNNLMFIVCGSASTWIFSKIFRNRGGLYNRTTARIHLKPFTLGETEQFLQSKGINWCRYSIAECYMVMGGVPFYLNQLSVRQTLGDNIDRLFFAPNALLRDEYSNLIKTAVLNAESSELIIQALATKSIGLTRQEIIKKTGLPNNGNLKKVLQHLEESDFVRIYNYYGQRQRDMMYQLKDFYLLFYFHFLKDRHGPDRHYWAKTMSSPVHRAWAGYAFEQVCKAHLEKVKKALGISGVLTYTSSWFGKSADNAGAQIDLLIERADHVINVCEIKFSENEYVITKDYDMKLRNKMSAFRYAERIGNKALHLSFITTYGVKRNMYGDIVQSQVVLDDLF